MILVVDTSRSMQAQDVEPTRLGAAQEALRTFLDQAPDDLRVGLIVFAGEAQVATPPTKDHAARRDRDHGHRPVPRLRRHRHRRRAPDRRAAGAAGDRPRADATTASRRRPARTRRGRSRRRRSCGDEKSPVSILFLSDGAQTRGLLQPLEGAQLAKDACFPVYTIALGTPEGVIERGPFGGIPGSPQDPPRSFRCLRIPRRCARSRRRPEASSPRRARPTR